MNDRCTIAANGTVYCKQIICKIKRLIFLYTIILIYENVFLVKTVRFADFTVFGRRFPGKKNLTFLSNQIFLVILLATQRWYNVRSYVVPESDFEWIARYWRINIVLCVTYYVNRLCYCTLYRYDIIVSNLCTG